LFAPSLHALTVLLTPLSVFFDTLAKIITKLLRVPQEPTVTEGELAYLIDTLAESESEPEGKRRSALLRSALDFDSRTVEEVMTPLDKVVGVALTMTHDEVRNIIRENKHSRLPVYLNTPDNIVGILDIRTYIRETLNNGKKFRLHQLLSKALRVPGSKRIDDLLDEMTQSRTHMCAVADDHGRVIGIITVEDILEELVGEIMDEDDVGQVEETETALGGERA
jgi:CBS domain containing-hemolysin-like protein